MKSIPNNSSSIPQARYKCATSYAVPRVRNCIRGVALVLSGAFAFLSYSSASWAQTYYVDAVNGSDSWPGTLPDAQGASGPWKTLSKVNDTYFVPGDSVYDFPSNSSVSTRIHAALGLGLLTAFVCENTDALHEPGNHTASTTRRDDGRGFCPESFRHEAPS